MKFPVFLALLASLLYCPACKTSQKGKTNAAAQTSAPESPTPAPPAPPAKPQPRLVQVPIDDLPPATASRRGYFSTNWWNINAAVGNDDMLIANYRHKWLKFKEDMTFEILIQEKPVDKGRWNYDETKDELYLVCSDPYINNTWVVKSSGFRMVWVGNTAVNTTGYQLRVVNTKGPRD